MNGLIAPKALGHIGKQRLLREGLAGLFRLRRVFSGGLAGLTAGGGLLRLAGSCFRRAGGSDIGTDRRAVCAAEDGVLQGEVRLARLQDLKGEDAHRAIAGGGGHGGRCNDGAGFHLGVCGGKGAPQDIANGSALAADHRWVKGEGILCRAQAGIAGDPHRDGKGLANGGQRLRRADGQAGPFGCRRQAQRRGQQRRHQHA